MKQYYDTLETLLLDTQRLAYSISFTAYTTPINVAIRKEGVASKKSRFGAPVPSS
jgi:hypothetical protein